MRKLESLNKSTQTRLRKYIEQWPTIPTKELADDLYLRNTTVAAVKAHITRRLQKRFNEALSN